MFSENLSTWRSKCKKLADPYGINENNLNTADGHVATRMSIEELILASKKC
jgi:hypothetical protein